MSKTVKLSVEVSPTLAMQILELIAGGPLPTTVVNNQVTNGPEPTVDEAAAEEVANEEAEAEADEEPEEDPEEDEEASEEESEESEEESDEEEQTDDEEPEADDEEGEEEADEDNAVDEAVEYTLDDIREELGKFMKGYKTQAAGKKALGAILASLPTPAKCLSDVEECEYGDLMTAIGGGDDDPLA